LGRYDLSGLPGPVALRERLADAFAAQAGYGGSWNSPSTCRSSFYLLKSFCDFLATVDPPMASFEELRAGHWNDFQLFLRTERHQGPESLGGTLTIVRTLLSRLDEIPAATRGHIDRWWRTPHDEQAGELRVLTAAEFDRVRTAARRHALLARRRIIGGWALLERWRRDPSALTLPDRRLAAVLDHLARYGDVRRGRGAYVMGPGRAPVHLRHSTIAAVGGVRKVTGMLFPTKADLVALAVLFVCEAGFNRSVIETLPARHDRPDGAVGDTEVRTVATDKPRRGARRHSTHSFVDGVDVNSLSAYRLALDITAGAHRVLEALGHPTDRLLVHWSGQRNGAGLRLQVALPLAESEIVWAEHAGLRTDPDDNGETLALRATLPELRRSFQVLGRRPAQNTLRTHVRSYLARSSVARDEARDTITAGLTDALAATRALTLARVLTAADVDESRTDPAAVAERFGVSVPTLERVLSRRADTVLAGCTDFHHSPHAPAGEACPASFLACLACPNALATPGHVPVQVAVHDALSEIASAVDEHTWAARYAPHLARLGDLLNGHTTPTERDDARGQLSPAEADRIRRLLTRDLDPT
ncbi:MAG: hypothetical protein KY454_13110, partial [Actinobacteria bacterium]|nr:hypothetical protein [Actinomycetota bacterium]